MIVDVNSLNLQALRCFIFYNASELALSEQYGYHCNREQYEENLNTASGVLFLATTCVENMTTGIFCTISEYIDEVIHNPLYLHKVQSECSSQGITTSTCSLTVTDTSTSCSGGLTINILQ